MEEHKLRQLAKLIEAGLHVVGIVTYIAVLRSDLGTSPFLDALTTHPVRVSIAILWPTVLILYNQIFRKFPFEEIVVAILLILDETGVLERVQKTAGPILLNALNRVVVLTTGASFLSDGENTTNISEDKQESAIEFYENLATESRELAKTIMLRSQVYLFVGCFIALLGLAFFYVETNHIFSKNDTPITSPVKSPADTAAKITPPASSGNSDQEKNDNVYSLVREYAPRIAILFFIEFVALFFLKQHRSTMDEFRYYEQIGRRREETVALLKFSSEIPDFDKKTLANTEVFRSNAQILDKEQTTELLETKKLDKGESELLAKIVDLISQSKK